MTILTPAIPSPDMLFLSERCATRYATDMRKEHADPHYTVARYTTAQAAEMLGISRVTVQAAIRRGRLESELASPNVRLISQAAIDAYREHHLGQVGQPTRKKQKMMQKMVEARKAAAGATSPSDVSAGDTGTPDANDETEE